MNFYQVLGLENFAPFSKVKERYRKLAMKLHPDRGGDEEGMKTLTYIYDVLSKHKGLYDKKLRQALTPAYTVCYSFYNYGGTGTGAASSTTAAW